MRPCTIIGNVGGDPELRFTSEGTSVCNFSLALYAGEDKDKNPITTWVRVSCWKDLAELVNAQVKKGDKVQVEGFLMPVEVYQKDDKTTGYSLKLTAWSVDALEYTPRNLVSPEPDEKGKGKKK